MKFSIPSRVTPRVVAISAVAVVVVLVVIGLLVFFGEDPGAAVRARYRADQGLDPVEATPTPTAAPAPTGTPLLSDMGRGSDGGIDIVPPDAADLADFESRPALPGFGGAVAPDLTLPAPIDPGPAQPLPPPVPDSLTGGVLAPEPQIAPPRQATPAVAVAPERYLFRNLATTTLATNPVAISDSKAKGYAPDKFAPEGESIVVALMDNVITSDAEIPVIAGVWEPFYSGGHKLLDIGDRLIGTAAPGKKRDRVNITFNKVIFISDRQSIPMTGIATSGLDGSVGVEGKVVGNLFLQSIFPVLLEMTAGFTETFKQRVLVGSNQNQDGTPAASGGIQNVPSLNNAVITSGGSAIDKVSDLLADDIEENAPYVVVTAGTKCRVLLTAPLDTADPDYGR